jgi:predicted nucleotidyltransferase
VVSAYEAGARQPSLPTLLRLVRAAGFDLDIALREVQPHEERTADRLGQLLARHRHEVTAIAQRYGLTNVRVFGSVARSEETPQSDIDLLVDVAAGVGLVGLARCQRDLEELLDARVDLVPAGGLKEGVAHSVLTEARPL